MDSIECVHFYCLEDNIGVLLHDPTTQETACIDVPDAARVLAEAKKRNWSLTHIFITHHHSDHTQGVAEVARETRAKVFGPAGCLPPEANNIELTPVSEGMSLPFGTTALDVLETPGHTRDHVVYWIKPLSIAFTGDTLFVMGCGRMFEASPTVFWNALEKLLTRLPDETRFYSGHDYALANARFACHLEPDNRRIQERYHFFEKCHAHHKCAQPANFGEEKATNPFLRVKDPAFQKKLGYTGCSPVDIFADLRRKKDAW